MTDRKLIAAFFGYKGVAAVVEAPRVIEIVKAERLYTDILHCRRNIDLAAPNACAISIGLYISNAVTS